MGSLYSPASEFNDSWFATFNQTATIGIPSQLSYLNCAYRLYVIIIGCNGGHTWIQTCLNYIWTVFSVFSQWSFCCSVFAVTVCVSVLFPGFLCQSVDQASLKWGGRAASSSWTDPCRLPVSEWAPWWLSSVLTTSKGHFELDDDCLSSVFFLFWRRYMNKVVACWYFSFFSFCRNFDEVLSSFAEPLLETAPYSESSSLYEEENFRVSAVVKMKKAFVFRFSAAADFTSIPYRTRGRTQSTSLTCP